MDITQRILLVDDDPGICELAEMALSTIGGFEVCACGSGQDALDSIEKFNPDIVLLDSHMPNMSGPETLAAIRALTQFKSTPAIFVTGDSQQQEIDHLISLGAVDVITKPFDPMKLSEQVKVSAGF